MKLNTGAPFMILIGFLNVIAENTDEMYGPFSFALDWGVDNLNMSQTAIEVTYVKEKSSFSFRYGSHRNSIGVFFPGNFNTFILSEYDFLLTRFYRFHGTLLSLSTGVGYLDGTAAVGDFGKKINTVGVPIEAFCEVYSRGKRKSNLLRIFDVSSYLSIGMLIGGNINLEKPYVYELFIFRVD